eukprot:4961737-Pyramimonas_sp.AAC.2
MEKICGYNNTIILTVSINRNEITVNLRNHNDGTRCSSNNATMLRCYKARRRPLLKRVGPPSSFLSTFGAVPHPPRAPYI